jgi:cell division protein FtsI (penicillin-binding protein 3)
MDRSSRLTPLMTPSEPSGPERMTRLRLMLLTLCVSLWALLIVGKLVMLHLSARHWEELAADQRDYTQTLHPKRGPILDRTRQPLALSVEHESIIAEPRYITDPLRTTAELDRVLGLDDTARKNLLAALQSRKFVWVRRKADPGVARAVRDLQLEGIGFITETKRYYPERELASHVLGWVDLDNKGGAGIEWAFDEIIRGKEEKVLVRRDAKRRPVGYTNRPSTEGHTVILTLDEAIQHAAETELQRAMFSTGATAGVAVVMDPRTGEILAMTNRPNFNPNRRVNNSDRWINRSIVNAYEPGSIFKVITAAAALDQKIVRGDDVIDCGGGFIEIAGQRINDGHVFWNLPFRDVMARSSNVGVIRVARQLGPKLFEQYVRDFGFGKTTGVELPGESNGIFRENEVRGAYSLASMSFGQGLSITALQMTSAMGAVASGGFLMKPLIVRRIENHAGEAVEERVPVAVRRVIQPSTVEALTEILKGVVRDGTGKRAAVPGYTVAGKTGTAQMIDARTGGYSMVDHVASFVGFVPASRPALVILVSLERPRGANNEGGDVAAPVFSRIAAQALRRLAIPPDDASRVLRPSVETAALLPSAAAPRPVPVRMVRGGGMPSLVGMSAREASALAVRHGLMVDLDGSGRVVDQRPVPGHAIEPGQTCHLVLSREGWADLPAAKPAGSPDPRLAQVHP